MACRGRVNSFENHGGRTRLGPGATRLGLRAGTYEPAEVDPPDPRRGEVLVRVTAAGLCHSDLHVIDATPGSEFLNAFRELGRRHFQDDMCGKAQLCLEIWAEATRNPAIATQQTDVLGKGSERRVHHRVGEPHAAGRPANISAPLAGPPL